MPVTQPQVRHYPARVVIVHDGDSLLVDADCGLGIHGYEWVRLKGVRAPELSSGAAGEQARQQVLTWLADHAPDSQVMVTTFRTAGETKLIREVRSFIRYIAVIGADDGAVLNDTVIQLGYTDQGELVG